MFSRSIEKSEKIEYRNQEIVDQINRETSDQIISEHIDQIGRVNRSNGKVNT